MSPPCFHFFLQLLQLLSGQLVLGWTLGRGTNYRGGAFVVPSGGWLVDSDQLGVDAGVKQFPVFPQNSGIKDWDADRVYLTTANKTMKDSLGEMTKATTGHNRLLDITTLKQKHFVAPGIGITLASTMKAPYPQPTK